MESLRAALSMSVHRLLRRVHFDVIRFDPAHHPLARRKRLLESYGVDLVFDVGANSGQYAEELRSLGYRGRIVSFEPLSSAFAQLRARAAADPAWQVENVALGDRDEDARIHIAGNSTSSSLLDMLPLHLKSAPDSIYVDSEAIRVRRFDSLCAEHLTAGSRAFLKIDAQGYERKILDGAGAALERLVGLQVELSLAPLYKEAALFSEIIDRLAAAGFALMAFEPGHCSRDSGRLLQIDGLFFRE
jgi:FkbM family methyltransferase